MRITKKNLELSVENLSVKVQTITGKDPNYKLIMGDTRFGNVYSIAYTENRMTICSFMSAKELDAYIWGMYKAFDIVNS